MNSTELFTNDSGKIVYDKKENRAQLFLKDNQKALADVAMKSFDKKNRSFWDKLEIIWKKKFSWNWIKVKDDRNSDSTQLINMDSITKQVGLKSSEIRKFNKSGKLYEEMLKKAIGPLGDSVGSSSNPNPVQVGGSDANPVGGNPVGGNPVPVELSPFAAVDQSLINEIKKNEIKNPNAINALKSTVVSEDISVHSVHPIDVKIYFNTSTGNITFDQSSDFEAYLINANLFVESGRIYIKINDVPSPNPFSPLPANTANQIKQDLLGRLVAV